MAAAAAAALLVTGCSESGGDQQASAEAEASASAEAAAEREAEAQAELERRRAAAAQRRQECQKSTGRFRSSLEEIDSRLSVGMNFSEYSEKVGDAQVAYDRLFDASGDVDLSAGCVRRVAVALEGALNDYIRVYNVWNGCIGDYSCDFSEGDTNKKAQDGWRKASSKLDKAASGLEKLGSV